MKVEVNGAEVHIATGGKPFDSELPTVLFLHGSGLDHRSWALQTRWFAYHGFAVVAPDFPAHSLSRGDALTSIEQSGQWLLELLNALAIDSAHVVGHSQGFLSALELVKQKPEAVRSLSGVGTAAAIPVNQMLIDTAKQSTAKAANMMMQWGFGQSIHMGTSPTPGMQPIAIGKHIMSNNPLSVDLQCCADYQAGEAVIADLDLPSLMVLADQDKMTPLKAGLAAAEKLGAQTHIIEGFGHMLPIEAPKRVLTALRGFITDVEQTLAE